MTKKKILLYTRHEGLTRFLTNSWGEHFDVFLQEKQGKFRNNRVAKPDNKEIDIIVSTLFHPELGDLAKTHDGHCPVVAYVTDPFGEEYRDHFRACSKHDWFHAVGCEPCYPKELIWPC